MTTPDNTSPRSGLGWLPKLILWGLVITFAYLYLSSIDREGTPSFTEVVDSINQLNPLAITALPSAEPAMTPTIASQTAAITTAVKAANAPAAVQPIAPAPFDPNLIAWQQDRIRAQYEAQYEAQYDAMRREADERMRQRWQRMPPPVPVASPYGYPGFLPGYAPGYAPHFYPPPR